MRRHLLSAIFLTGLVGCASTVPGPSQAAPHWDGALGGKRLGVYLMTPRGPFTVAQFECLSQADDVLKDINPALRWTQVDSSSKGVRQLGGWDLDSLGEILLADSAVWRAAPSGGVPALSRSTPALGTATRDALLRVGKAYEVDQILVLRPGLSRNAKDSAKSFRESAWFGLFDPSSGAQLYSLSVPLEGSRSASRSAEADWAREAWKAFARGVKGVRSR